MAQGENQQLSLTGNFSDVIAEESGTRTLDFSNIQSDLILRMPGGEIVRLVAPEAASVSVNQKAFQPGHVFRTEELPNNEKHLAGGLYFENNPDGTMHIVSAEQFETVGTWDELQNRVQTLKQEGHDVRIGIEQDWDSLLASQFVASASLDMSGQDPYWRDIVFRFNEQVTMVLYLDRDGSYPREQDKRGGVARGRLFFNEPQFQPVTQ